MTSSATRIAVLPLHIPLLAFLMLALAVSTTFVLEHGDRAATYAVAASAHATAYGSSTALRNLLF